MTELLSGVTAWKRIGKTYSLFSIYCVHECKSHFLLIFRSSSEPLDLIFNRKCLDNPKFATRLKPTCKDTHGANSSTRQLLNLPDFCPSLRIRQSCSTPHCNLPLVKGVCGISGWFGGKLPFPGMTTKLPWAQEGKEAIGPGNVVKVWWSGDVETSPHETPFGSLG